MLCSSGRQQLQNLEGLLKPLREVSIKMKIKVANDSNYQVFLKDAEATHKQMDNIVLPALEALCQAETMSKETMSPTEVKAMSERFTKQTGLIRLHITSARAAIARFNGILGVVESQKK